jgi:uncharacterized membrane protein YidH (DUF202 family)
MRSLLYAPSGDHPHSLDSVNSPGSATWFVVLGRAGLAARGAVYVVVGALAAMAAFGIGGGKVVDQREAVRAMGSSPFGDLVLWIIGAGLASYALWRFAQVARVGSDEDSKPGKRAVALISGIAYAGLAMTAFTQAIGSSSSGGDQSRASWLMSQPFGRWLVAGVGVAILGAALFQFYRAFTESFAKKLSAHELTADQERWSRRAGRLGYSARGIAFGLIGWFFLRAGMHSDASEAGGLALALRTVRSQPYGDLLLAVVATGLALFGVYSLIEARYRRIT